MTTIGNFEVTCSVCGTNSIQQSVTSSYVSGSPDLDLRPPGLLYDTFQYWIQDCPDCGYAYSSIDEKPDNCNETMASNPYLELLNGSLKGTLEGKFLRASLIHKENRNYEEAGNCALCAAWVADDIKDNEFAVKYRNQAANLFIVYLINSKKKRKKTIETRTKLVDILRRAGRWDEAIEIAENLLSMKLDSIIESILAFEIDAINKQDSNCHSVNSAMK